MPKYALHALTRPPADRTNLLEALAGHDYTIQEASGGNIELRVTITADSVAHAGAAALSMLEQAGDLQAMNVGTATALVDLASWENIPPLNSVTEVATETDTTRQAVLQRIRSGTLSARKVGREFAILPTHTTTSPSTERRTP